MPQLLPDKRGRTVADYRGRSVKLLSSFERLDDRYHETTQLHLGLSAHGMRPLRASHMIRTLEALN